MLKSSILLLALLIDLTVGDPPNRFHPVVLMGNWLTKGRQLAPRRRRFWFGTVWIVTGIMLFALPWQGLKIRRAKLQTGAKAGHNLRSLPQDRSASDRSGIVLNRLDSKSLLQIIFSALLLKPVFAYRNLRQNVASVAEALTADDLGQARHLAGWHLVSRDTRCLTADEVAGAAIESLAENLTDSVTAPLIAYSLGGLPAAWAYRFINTADAMWGYRTTEFEQLGKFPARLDDTVNWLPARLTACLLIVSAWLTGEDAGRAKQVMLGQHGQTSSPNAGWTMSAMAGALRTTLTKQDAYQLVGGPSQPEAAAIMRAVRIADVCVGLTVVTMVLLNLYLVILEIRVIRGFKQLLRA